jgi:translation initiation factor IF-3
VRRFLDNGDKVKVTIMFRGRETTHPERGEQLLMRLAEDVEDLGTVEQRPSLDGRNMTMVMNPLKAKERKPEPDRKGKGKRGEPDAGDGKPEAEKPEGEKAEEAKPEEASAPAPADAAS